MLVDVCSEEAAHGRVGKEIHNKHTHTYTHKIMKWKSRSKDSLQCRLATIRMVRPKHGARGDPAKWTLALSRPTTTRGLRSIDFLFPVRKRWILLRFKKDMRATCTNLITYQLYRNGAKTVVEPPWSNKGALERGYSFGTDTTHFTRVIEVLQCKHPCIP